MSLNEEPEHFDIDWYPGARCTLLGTPYELEMARRQLSFCFVESFDEKADHEDLLENYDELKAYAAEYMDWGESTFDVRRRMLEVCVDGEWMKIAPWSPLWQRTPRLDITYVRHDMNHDYHVMEEILRDPGSVQDVIMKLGCWSSSLCVGGYCDESYSGLETVNA